MAAGSLTASARTSLLAGSNVILTTTSGNQNDLKNLLDNNVNTTWHSTNTGGNATITIDLQKTVTLASDESLVFFMRRCSQHDNLHPTMVDVTGGVNDNFEHLWYAYFLYRGKGTDEFTERVKTEKPFSKLQLTVLVNNAREFSETVKAGIADLEIYVVKDNETFNGTWRDRMHLIGDYRNEFRKSTFVNTNGILDERNRKYSDAAENWCDWSAWSNGVWTKDTAEMHKNGIEIPDFSMLTNQTTGTKLSGFLANGQERQPTHTTEHILYAIPGDAIALYPYYEMQQYAHDGYVLTYSHWYDWKTGGRLVHTDNHGEQTDMLDFLIDPSNIYYSRDYGFFAGPEMSKYRYTDHLLIYTPEDWLQFVRYVNNDHRHNITAEIMDDLDFAGYDDVLPVGSYGSEAFAGKIDGHGHVIKNLHVHGAMSDTGTYDMGTGLFGNVTNGCEIRNIVIDNSCTFTAERYVSGVTGRIRGKLNDDNGNELPPVIISNVVMEGTIIATKNDDFVGGIIGRMDGYKSYSWSATADNSGLFPRLEISNCHIGGHIELKGAIDKTHTAIGHIGAWDVTHGKIENVFISTTFSHPSEKRSLRFDNQTGVGTVFDTFNANFPRTNCYGSQSCMGDKAESYNFNRIATDNPADATVLSKLNKNVKNFEVKGVVLLPVYYPMTFSSTRITLPDRAEENGGLHGYPRADFGTNATFFCPRDPDYAEGSLQPLPFENGQKEFIIAADFSHSFSMEHNIVPDPNNPGYDKIVEPIIHFRHIFRIRDGKTFADNFSADYDKNQEFAKKNTVRVSARQNDKFQIRLDCPAPVKNGTPSRYYYKVSDKDYRRVGTMEIRVFDAETMAPIENHGFLMAEKFPGMGSRTISGKTYNICGGGGEYYRMLQNETMNSDHKNLLVQIIGNDMNGEHIYFGNDPTKPLIVQQFEITVEPASRAFFITENELYSNPEYRHARPETLEVQGNMSIADRVTFDEYRMLETLKSDNASTVDGSDYLVGSDGKFWYKWPVGWKDSNYAFGYDYATSTDRTKHYDYNEYILTTHSSLTPYHAAADEFPVTFFDKQYNQADGGLYDRLYYETRRLGRYDASIKPERGYFYYVNAATDPGVMARLEVNALCAGATVHVSAWISEFSKATLFEIDEKTGKPVNTGKPGETANVAFNFIAVMKEGANIDRSGERVKMHTFITGYVPYDAEHYGHWMNAYYSFTPDFADMDLILDDIDHFELELDNNCKSSTGADYAVDDITLYIENPTVEAKQLSELCNKTTADEMRVKVEADFDVLMQSLDIERGTADKNETINVYYTFIDKAEFDKLNDKNSKDAAREAYETAVVRYNYNDKVDDDGKKIVTPYGLLTMNTYFMGNKEYSSTTAFMDEACREIDDDGTRKIVFNTSPKIKDLQPGKSYYVAMSLRTRDEAAKPDFTPGWDIFNINSNCTLQCVFTVQETTIIKVDGEISEQGSRTSYCENMQPVIQVNLYGLNKETGEVEVIERNAHFDWYYGTYDQYLAENKDGLTLKDALNRYRLYYDSEEDIENAKPIEAESALTQEMLDYLKDLSTTIPPGGVQPILSLYKKSYVFPPLKIPNGLQETDVYALAIPIEKDRANYHICAEPTIVSLHVNQKSPALAHGLRQGIKYPEYMFDVPVRASLQQLKNASAEPQSDLGLHATKLVVPVRSVNPTGVTGADAMRRASRADGESWSEITLVWTDDPEYTDLGSPDQTGKEAGLLAVGQITDIKASKQTLDTNDFYVVFYNNFRFKEGCTYRLRFPFEEDADNNTLTEDQKKLKFECPGHDVFTVKVVPAYMKWTGKDNHNFNNDHNWRRISSDEMNKTLGGFGDDNNEYFTDGQTYVVKTGFTPMDFSNVIIPTGTTAPHLFGLTTSPIPGLAGLTDIVWPENPSARPENFVESSVAYPFEPSEATKDIQYDMAAYDYNGVVHCRSWYPYTCKEIHFEPETAIVGQELLTYKKAWVDMELSPLLWHLLSVPLKEAFAGDFYAPTDGAREKAEYYTPIYFANSRNDRFRPAVYQRGWNMSKATVYEIKDGPSRNVTVHAGWSNVFNDVKEQYGAGIGFSLKADLSEAKNVNASTKALFRLPKADTAFLYYEKDREKPGAVSANQTAITRTDARFELNDANGTVYARSAKGSTFFLVGNPLMTHLDMARFLDANKAKIEQKYWLVTESTQTSAIFDPESEGFFGDAENLGCVAPMQSFFVEAKEGAAVLKDPVAPEVNQYMELALGYSQDMETNSETVKLRMAATRAGIGEPLQIKAVSGGRMVSSALIRTDVEAVPGFVPSRDVEALDNREGLGIPAIVYVANGGMASSIATLQQLEGAEIGVLTASDTERITLRFEGTEAASGLSLYDTNNGSQTVLYEGMEYEVRGSTAGLYLVSGVSDGLGAPLKYHVEGDRVTVTASKSDARLHVLVADAAGRCVIDSTTEGKTEFTLESGVYVLRAEDCSGTITAKILIR